MNTIIGLFGMLCAGKDTVADVLEEKGYKKVSMSNDLLKPVLKSLKLKPSRLNYIKLGKSLKKFKPDALSFLVHGLLNKGGDCKYVIPNIMTFQEARFFKEQDDIRFLLFKVSAGQRTRYERNLQRQGEKDVNDLVKFKRLDQQNLSTTGLKELMHARLEDAELINDGSLKELQAKINDLFKEFNL